MAQGGPTRSAMEFSTAIAIGVALGVAVGVALGDIGMGIGIGIAFGAAFAGVRIAMDDERRKPGRDTDG